VGGDGGEIRGGVGGGGDDDDDEDMRTTSRGRLLRRVPWEGRNRRGRRGGKAKRRGSRKAVVEES